jgi:catechol 2,3-dioxygenase-like lactoylglutathione lyase family enzyme
VYKAIDTNINSQTMLITNANVTINVKDLDASISFYESIGLTVRNRWGNYYAQLVAPGITIGLHPSNNLPGNSGNASIGFTADNFDDARSLLEQLAIKTTARQEEGGAFLLFNDPDGTALYFIKPKW